ncbi:MAG: hypothetical protein KJO18_08695 [Acidimicrobiia bacterium]|nr:hypothetical protein [Acidimicrobiia bacterium]
MEQSTLEERERQLTTELYPKLRAFAEVTCSEDIEPDDVVQQALERTLVRHNLLELDNALAYLRRSIIHLASNERRRLARRRKAIERLSVDDGHVPSYPSHVEAILDLPGTQRAVLYLVYVELMPYAEAAHHLGMSAVAARKAASRAKHSARLTLQVEHG